MQALIDVILPVFLVVGFGYVLVWRKFLNDLAIDGIMKFAQQVAVPCLLFNALAHIDLNTGFDPALLFSFYTGAGTCFALGLIGARYVFNRSWEDSVAIGFCALFSNSVLLGLAITERAYGTDALAGNYAIIAMHSPFCYGLGITVMEVVRAREAGTAMTRLPATVLKAMFSNVLIVAITLGFLFNISGLSVPGVAQGALDMMVRTALPTALFALGGILYRYRPEGDLRVILFVCALSLLLHPLITFSLSNGLGVPDAGMRSAVLTSAMAPGVNVYIFASMYGRAQRVAASTVLIATALSIFSAWFWLSVLP
ncbi:MAG: AEC family transporter [Planktotalea sp.]|uniref:AEC family transporter n=1 Tax=Planktotalea sp. TaxID=2029877 RepID=UPI003C71B611